MAIHWWIRIRCHTFNLSSGEWHVHHPLRWDTSSPPHYWYNYASVSGSMVWGQLESRLMFAATCVGYFMRAGEFTAVGTAPPSILLSEVAINSRSALTAVHLQLCRAKTDPFGRGVEIFLGVSGTAVCPFTALMRYLAVRPPGMVSYSFGRIAGLSQGQLFSQTHLRRGFQSAGLDMSQFSGHSLRIGAATSSAAAGVPDHLIKTLGWWCSEAYPLYIHDPRESLLGVAPLIGTPTR